MKNFPNTKSLIEVSSIVDDVSNILHAEWNLNKYIPNPSLVVEDTIPTNAANEEKALEARQIATNFSIDNIVIPNRDNMTAYVIEGTKYKVNPVYTNQRHRTDSSWQNDITWLWYGDEARYKYWTSSLAANASSQIPHNTANILYTWNASRPANKIRILFNKAHAFPVSWSIYIDTTGTESWNLISNNEAVPANGEFVLYRNTANQPTLTGDWTSEVTRWSETFDNHVDLYGIKVVINTVDLAHGRPAIMELSPRLEADLSSFLVDWNTTEEAGDQDFISPIGTASANTGSVTLSNNTGMFNEQDIDGLLYKMMDEDVEFRGYLKYGQDTIPMLTMVSDSWDTSGMDECTVNLVDPARLLQNIECKDMILSKVNAGSALHQMFASLGLKQFNLLETTPKQTPVMEKFYTKREQKVWEIVQSVCKSFQMSAFFDSAGNLQICSKEKLFNEDSEIEYTFDSETRLDKISDIFSADRSENSRFNKVVIRYNAINNFSLSGKRSQKLWTAPDDWGIGAAQIIKNISAGQNYFVIDPNRPNDLPRYSGTVIIENRGREFEWEGKQFFCKNAVNVSKYFRVTKPSEYLEAVERNNGEAPRFTGKIFLKDGATFHKDFAAKNYSLRQDWDVIVYKIASNDGTRSVKGIKHSEPDGCLKVELDFSGGKRLNVTRKSKSWNRYDRIGMKFKALSNAARTGLVVWPQGRQGAAGYYFMVDPMSAREIQKAVSSNDDGADSTNAPSPKIHGFIIKANGDKVDMSFDNAKDFREVPPLRVNRWNHLEVAVYNVTGGYEFEVFVNGQYCKTYTDKTVVLSRTETGGMSFTGNGNTLVDKFYVVNYPTEAIKIDKDDSGFIVRRADLWRDRKKSPGDDHFNKYLKMLNKMKKTQLFDYDFSGRTHAIAREKVTERVRFENPAMLARLTMTNSAVRVVNFEPFGWGAKIVLLNESERNQLLKGTKKTRVTDAERYETTFISGESFKIADTQEVEHKNNNLIDKLGPLPIEFESEWIQDRETAADLAKWVLNRFGENAEVYELEVFGNPLLEIADTVEIIWPDRGFDDTIKWCVTKIGQSWSDGLVTTLTVRKII